MCFKDFVDESCVENSKKKLTFENYLGFTLDLSQDCLFPTTYSTYFL